MLCCTVNAVVAACVCTVNAVVAACAVALCYRLHLPRLAFRVRNTLDGAQPVLETVVQGFKLQQHSTGHVLYYCYYLKKTRTN